ncbi:MAG: CBS domain-containing protein, partial [Phenylobacterium sp.]|nr:CBS domain-containing protein [Phenylobacterium sp.]
MLVSQILRAKGDAVFTVTPADTVGRVAELLHSRRVGAFVVTKGETVVGIVSERDIVRAVAGGDEKVTSRPVSAYMTADVVFADPG